YVSNDGHVLMITDAEATWLSPDGEKQWTRDGEQSIRAYTGYTPDPENETIEPRWEPVAADGGTMVMQRCSGDHDHATCTTRGIDSAGEVAYEFHAPSAGSMIRT